MKQWEATNRMNLNFNNYHKYTNHLLSAEQKQFDKYRKHILKHCQQAQSRCSILNYIGVEENYENYKKYIVKLITERYLSYTDPRHPQSPKQTFIVTQKGLNYLKAIS